MFENTSIADLRNILTGSVIRFGSDPFLICNIIDADSFFLHGYTIEKGQEHSVVITDPRLNFEPVPLGYMDCNSSVDVFTYRTPMRQYRVGLGSENFQYSIPLSSTLADIHRMEARDRAQRVKRDISASKKNTALYKCISGVFSPIDKAFDAIEEGRKTVVALSRDFAVDKDFCLFFRTDMVGIITENGVPQFSRGRSYLQQFWEKIHAGV